MRARDLFPTLAAGRERLTEMQSARRRQRGFVEFVRYQWRLAISEQYTAQARMLHDLLKREEEQLALMIEKRDTLKEIYAHVA